MLNERLVLKENPNKWNVLEVSTSYNLGGQNYFTGNTEKRGYYLHVQPMEIHGNCRTVTGFSGIKYCLKEVKRKSAKAEAEADRIANNIKASYINYVLQKHNLKLK
jgi:hypothetical protein